MKGVAAATTATLKNSTLKWLDTIIVGRKLCPFAPSVRHAPKLSLCISDATNDDDVLQAVRTEANLITQGILRAEGTLRTTATTTAPSPETSLIVLDPDRHPALRCFRNFVQLSWKIQTECINPINHHNPHNQELLQIVLFHPQAVHDTYTETPPDTDADTEADEDTTEGVVNYTIRSPYPTIHILREDQILSAVQNSTYKNLDGLPQRNKAKLIKDGLQFWQQKLRACYDV